MSNEWSWNELGAVAENVLRQVQEARVRQARRQREAETERMQMVQEVRSRVPSMAAEPSVQTGAQLELPLFTVVEGSAGQAARAV